MTPNNILNMAMLKELDFVAITDHNSTRQLKVIDELQKSYDFILIPGVEVSVKEGFDVLCYFRSFEDSILFNDFLEKSLNGKWGRYTKEDQVVTDIYDTTLMEYNRPLRSTSIPYKSLVKEVYGLNGAIVIAHIDRPSCTPLKAYNLEDLDFDGLEIAPINKDDFLKNNDYVNQFKLFYNSDSHTLLTMSEKDYYFELEDKTLESFFNYIKGE